MDERSVKRLAVIILTAVALILLFKSIGIKMATKVGQEHQKALAVRQASTPPAPPAAAQPEPLPATPPAAEPAPAADGAAESAPAALAPAAPPGQEAGIPDVAPGQATAPNAPAGN